MPHYDSDYIIDYYNKVEVIPKIVKKQNILMLKNIWRQRNSVISKNNIRNLIDLR